MEEHIQSAARAVLTGYAARRAAMEQAMHVAAD